MNPLSKPKVITNKYDLMHRNTPAFASTVVTWDTSKLTQITFNRVVKWLETGVSKYNSGDAASMYNELRKHFKLPEYVVRNFSGNPQSRNGQGYLYWEHATPQLMQALDKVYQAERVIHRMENSNKQHYYTPWYLSSDKLNDKHGYIYLDNVHDLSDVEKYVAEITNSEELKAKRAQAVEFVRSGGQLQFTWRV